MKDGYKKAAKKALKNVKDQVKEAIQEDLAAYWSAKKEEVRFLTFGPLFFSGFVRLAM